MKKLKLSTVFAIIGLVSYLLALWFMYKETSSYYENLYDQGDQVEEDPEPEEEEKEIKPKIKLDEPEKPGSEIKG